MKFKSIFLPACMALLTVVFMYGCSTLGGGKSDEELVKETTAMWAQGLIEHDMEKFLGTISESFSSEQYEAADKQTLGDFVKSAIEDGYIDEAEVSFEDSQYTLEEGVYSVYPIDLMSAAGSVSVELKLKKEGSQWLIIAMNVDGL